MTGERRRGIHKILSVPVISHPRRLMVAGALSVKSQGEENKVKNRIIDDTLTAVPFTMLCHARVSGKPGSQKNHARICRECRIIRADAAYKNGRCTSQRRGLGAILMKGAR